MLRLVFMRKIIVLLVLLVFAGCRQVPAIPVPTFISPYQIDIQQGNVVTQEMVAKLKPGMTRAQVRFVLGSPLIVDAFRTDRWDYMYMYQKQGKPVERRNLTVIFEDDKLLRLEGDVTTLPPAVTPGLSEKPTLKPASPAAPAAAGPTEAVKSDSAAGATNPGAQTAKPEAKED